MNLNDFTVKAQGIIQDAFQLAFEKKHQAERMCIFCIHCLKMMKILVHFIKNRYHSITDYIKGRR